jgi:uncharacterized integral membrane protein
MMPNTAETAKSSELVEEPDTLATPAAGVRSTPVGSSAGTTAAPRRAIRASRAGRTWVAIGPSLVVLAIILVFVFQNLHSVKVNFFTLSGRFPLAVALLGAIALGIVVVLALGSVRILQLRKAVRHQKR